MNDKENTSPGAEESVSRGLTSDELQEASRRLGYPEVPEIVAAVSTPLARGHHIPQRSGDEWPALIYQHPRWISR